MERKHSSFGMMRAATLAKIVTDQGLGSGSRRRTLSRPFRLKCDGDAPANPSKRPVRLATLGSLSAKDTRTIDQEPGLRIDIDASFVARVPTRVAAVAARQERGWSGAGDKNQRDCGLER